MGAGDQADCAFMYVSFLLALCYLSLLAFVVRYLSRLFRREDKRRAQKFFLALVVLQCVGRVTYFLVWPLVGDTCDPTLTSNTFSLLDVAGTMPPAFFISAFSVLVFTFARIYHCILRHNTAQQQRLFRALAVFLVGMNVCVYAGTITQYISSAGSGFIPDDLEAYLLSVVCFVVALLFLLYGTLLYIECQKVIREASATPQQSHGIPGPKFSSASAASSSNPYQPHHPSSHSRGTMAQDVASAMGRSTGLAPPQTPSPPGSDAPTVQPNPMRKIAIIAAICTLCLTVRTILIPLVDFLGGSFSWPVLLVYLFFAEILPLILMLKVFDTSAASQPARAAGNGLDAPLLGDGAVYDDNNADRRHPDGRPAGASEADVNVSVTPTQSPRPAFGARHHSPQRSAPPNSLAAAHPVVPAMQSPPLYPQAPQPLSAAHQQRLHQQHLLAAGGMAFATNASGTGGGGGTSSSGDLLYGALPPGLLAFRDTSPAATVRPPSAAGSATGANSDPPSHSDVEVSYAY